MIDPIRLGLDHVAFVEVKLTDTREAALASFNAAVVQPRSKRFICWPHILTICRKFAADPCQISAQFWVKISLPHVLPATYMSMQAVKDDAGLGRSDAQMYCLQSHEHHLYSMFMRVVAHCFYFCPIQYGLCEDAGGADLRIDYAPGRCSGGGDEAEAQRFGNQLWEFWADAPDARAQEILDRGMTRRSAYDFLGALSDFDRLIDYCPEYAEGYNQRAFVHYLRRDFAAALRDLNRALELSPQHVAALSGRALSLLGLSRLDEARATLQEALNLNPWLPERYLLDPGGPLAGDAVEL